MKQVFTILAFLCCIGIISAQTPQGINYQAVARNPNSSPKTNTPLTVGIKIKDAFGTDLYTETHNPNSGPMGLFNLTIGQGSNPSTPFGNINWSNGSKLLEVIIDGVSGGTQALLSVPYALYAEKTNLQAGNGISVSGNTISNTGDLSNTNEIQNLSVNGNQLSISGSNTVTLPTPPVNTPEIYIFEERYNHNLYPTTGSGQNPVSNSFNTRNINTQVYPSSGGMGNVTVGGNGFLTFKPGTYLIEASAPASFVGPHQLFLRRVDNTIELLGTCEYAAFNGGNVSNGTGIDQSRSFIKGIMVVPQGNDRVVKLDHYLQFVYPSSAPFGYAFEQSETIWDTIKEVYTTILIQKIN